jgi:hypothetical protein
MRAKLRRFSCVFAPIDTTNVDAREIARAASGSQLNLRAVSTPNRGKGVKA